MYGGGRWRGDGNGGDVRVVGLQSSAGQALNGLSGRVIGFDTAARRLVVDLGEAGKKKLRRENLV